VSIQVAHTADLDASALTSARALLDDVFGADMTDRDWDHALGGVHALRWEGGAVIGHASVIQRRLLYEGRALRTGYVESVAVRSDRRRRGVGGALMNELERVIRAAYDLGALGATEDGAALYRSRGWRQWEGETWALSPSGPVRTESEDGDIYVLEVGVKLDVRAKLTCDWRDGDAW
jgi:aminoglycoside 2'-N-acetyltransferase I